MVATPLVCDSNTASYTSVRGVGYLEFVSLSDPRFPSLSHLRWVMRSKQKKSSPKPPPSQAPARPLSEENQAFLDSLDADEAIASKRLRALSTSVTVVRARTTMRTVFSTLTSSRKTDTVHTRMDVSCVQWLTTLPCIDAGRNAQSIQSSLSLLLLSLYLWYKNNSLVFLHESSVRIVSSRLRWV